MKSKPKYHLKRIWAKVKSADKEHVCRVVLNDIKISGLELFCKDSIPLGQEIEITLDLSKPYTLKAFPVETKRLLHNVKIVSEHVSDFRIAVQFKFESPEQEDNMQKFVAELATNHLGTNDTATKKAA